MKDKPNNELVASYYAVAFIDLLGQREAMRDLDRLPETKAEEAKFIAALKNSAGVVDDLNRSLRQFLDAAEEEHRQSYPEPLREVLAEMTAWELKHQRFSDGLVIFASLANKDRTCPVVGVGQMLLAAASLMLMSLAKGKPIRGGIDVGVGMELHPGELYGPVVAKAYQLESSVAQYPRIVVGDSLRDYLAQGASKAGQGLDDSFWKTSAESTMSFLGEDTDGHLIVDYLGEGVKAVFKDTIDKVVLNRAAEFVEKQGEIHRKARDTKLAMRYLLLTEYLSSRFPLWYEKEKQEV